MDKLSIHHFREYISDTDSLILRLRSEDIDEDYGRIYQTLDTSNFSKNHKLFTPSRASKLGYFKSEVGDRQIHIAAAIRSKCYSLVIGDQFETQNKLKGVNRQAVGQLSILNYLRTLLFNDTQYTSFSKISSKSHAVFVEKICKKSLASYDDKSKIRLCGICTDKYGQESAKDFCSCPFSRLVK